MIFPTNLYYLQILLQLCNILLVSPKQDLQSLLTKNQSKKWLQNQTSTSKNPYCSICCMNIAPKQIGRRCNQHTMCIYREDTQGPGCREMIPLGFSGEEIEAIVDAHNTLRNLVALGEETRGDQGPQPPASNMRLISWDYELANISLRWAKQCVFGHDKCRDVNRFPVGQNIAMGMSGVTHDLTHILRWYENVEVVNTSDIKAYKFNKEEEGSISHYTQLMWADTYLVGCARAIFQKADAALVTYREHFICNYGPAGNIPGQPVYKIGEACSSCLDGTGCTNLDYPGLCGNEMLAMDDTLSRKRREKRKKDEMRGKRGVEITDRSENISGSERLLVVVVVMVILSNILVC